MRCLISLILLLFVTATNAQLSLSVKAGWNNSTADVIKSQYTFHYVSHAGWQAGLRAEYSLQNWVLYSGLSVDKLRLYNSYANYNNIGVEYKPTFLTLPLGLGYNYGVTKNIGLRLYTGVYLQQGIGGRYRSKFAAPQLDPGFWCDPGPCPETYEMVERKLRLGNEGENDPADDMKPLNWGAQFGIGIVAFQRWELVWMYNLGLSNFIPMGTVDEDHRIRSISLDLKMNLKTFKTDKNK